MKHLRILSAALAAFWLVLPAWAATVNVDGHDYEVSTKTGTFNDLLNAAENPLSGQVWWENQSLAESFAAAVNDDLGLVNASFTEGPYFAWDESSFTGKYNASFYNCLDQSATTCEILSIVDSDQALLRATTSVFAIATKIDPVPLPAGGLLIVTAIGGLALVRRRSKAAA